MSDPRMDQVMAHARDLVKQHGWMVQGVFAAQGDPDPQPGFCYTIGLWQTFHKPEIIITGLGQATAHVLLNNLGDRVRRGEVFRYEEPYADVIENFTVEFTNVRTLNITTKDWFNMARAYYGHADFTAIQMLWPDPDGHMPGDPAYDSANFRQPILH